MFKFKDFRLININIKIKIGEKIENCYGSWC